jgi:hypothetical protein
MKKVKLLIDLKDAWGKIYYKKGQICEIHEFSRPGCPTDSPEIIYSLGPFHLMNKHFEDINE